MVDVENREKWEDAQQVSGAGRGWPAVPRVTRMSPPRGRVPAAAELVPRPQVSPGSVHLMKVVEDFIHLVGDALKAFQSSLIVTDNLGERRGGRGAAAGAGTRPVTPAVPCQ